VDERDIIEIPTELERSSEFLEYTVAAVAILSTLWMLNNGHVLPFNPWYVIPPILLVAGTWVLTGEAATNWQGVGSVATGLRNRIGLRRAHEWIQAFAHYVHLVHVPVWRAWCVAFWQSSRQRITRMLRASRDGINSARSATSSWASGIRCNLSRRLAR